MKPAVLFQLGGVAMLIAAVLYGVGNGLYFASGQSTAPTALGQWIAFVGDTLLVLGLGALYARQAQRAGILGLVGYVLLVVATMFFIGSYAVTLGVVAGLFTGEQTALIPSYAFATAIMPLLWFAGLIVFGVATVRTRVFPRYAGALLIVMALVMQLTGTLSIAALVFAVLSSASWGWLGWSLLMGERGAAREVAPAM